MNCGSEWQTLRAVEISFNAACATPWRSIEMDANKNRAPIRIRDGNARSQRNKDVAISCHYYAIARRLQHRFQTLRDIEVHSLLVHALARDAAAVVSAVSGINNNGRGRPRALRRNRPGCWYRRRASLRRLRARN